MSASQIPQFAQARKKHLLIVVSLACAILGLGFSYRALMLRLRERTASLQELIREKSVREAEVMRLEALKRFVMETEGERARLDGYFIKEKTVADFLNRAELLGRSLGLATETVSLGMRDSVLRVEVRAEGSFENLLRLSLLLERLPYKLRVSQALWDASETGGWTGLFNLDVVSYAE